MTCRKCGTSLAANANFCHHCGERQELPTAQPVEAQPQTPNTAPYPYNPYNPYNPYSRVSPFDAPNIGYAILCFFFPMVGLILYLVWKDEYPKRAKSAGKGALIGVITSVVLSIIFVVIWLGLIFWLMSDMPYYYF